MLWLLLFASTVSAFSRSFVLNRFHNGACVNIEYPTSNTSISLVFDQPLRDSYYENDVPVIMFNYLDLVKLDNLPNYIDFVEEPFSNYNENTSLRVFDDRPFFNLLPAPGQDKLPDSVFNTTAVVYGDLDDVEPQDEPKNIVDYPIPAPGIYCIYMPRYNISRYGNELDLMPHPYSLTVNINDEEQLTTLVADSKGHWKLAVIFSAIVVLLRSYHSFTKNGANLPIIVLGIYSLFLMEAIYFSSLAAVELVAVNFKINLIREIALKAHRYLPELQLNVIDVAEGLFFGAVYFGHGIIYDLKLSLTSTPTQSKFRVSKKRLASFVLLQGINIGTLLLNHMLVSLESLRYDYIGINGEKFTIMDKTVLLKGTYQHDTVSERIIDLIKYIRLTGLIYAATSPLRYLYSLVSGFFVERQLAKQKESQFLVEDSSRQDRAYLLAPLRYSLVLHWFIYRVFVKEAVALYFVPAHNFSGYFDFGEVLNYLSSVASRTIVAQRLVTVTDLMVLWLVWGLKERGLRPSDVKFGGKKPKEKDVKVKEKVKDEKVKEEDEKKEVKPAEEKKEEKKEEQ